MDKGIPITAWVDVEVWWADKFFDTDPKVPIDRRKETFTIEGQRSIAWRLREEMGATGFLELHDIEGQTHLIPTSNIGAVKLLNERSVL